MIFYTAAYAIADAEKLRRRVEERNTAKRYKLPVPQQGEFLPEPVAPPVSQASRGCANKQCSKPRNKDCTFSLCKPCCHARPILEKSCIKHCRDLDGSQLRTTITAPPSQIPLVAQSTTQTTEAVATPPPPASNDHNPDAVSDAPTSLPLTPNTRPVHRQADSQRSAGPLLEERIAAPRSDFASSGANISRRRAEGLQMSRNQCSIYIWLSVCFIAYSF